MERRKGCTGITQDDRTDVCYKCCRTYCICKGYAMVTRVRIRDPRIFSCCFPVEVSAVNDYTTDGCPMSTDEFGCRMNNDISTILDRSNQIRGCKCRVYYKRNVMLMSNLCHFFQIDEIRVRISKSLYENCFCVFLDRCFERTLYFRINKCCGNTIGKRQCMCKQVVGSTINSLGSYDVFS